MGFQIGYQKLIELRCWHPGYLGSVAPKTPYNGGPLTVNELKDLLRYDVRELVRIGPTAEGEKTLARYGLRWVASTLGGWVLSKDSLSLTGGTEVLQLGVELLSPGFATATDFAGTTGVTLTQLPGRPDLIGAFELDLTGPPATTFDLNFQPANP